MTEKSISLFLSDAHLQKCGSWANVHSLMIIAWDGRGERPTSKSELPRPAHGQFRWIADR